MKKAKDILKDLIEINTEIPEGNESIAVKYIYNLFKDKATKIETVGEYPRENIIAFFGSGHLFVVKVRDVLHMFVA